jgi:hypothetical protein
MKLILKVLNLNFDHETNSTEHNEISKYWRKAILILDAQKSALNMEL